MRANLNPSTALGAVLASLALTMSCGGVDAEERGAEEPVTEAAPEDGIRRPPPRPEPAPAVAAAEVEQPVDQTPAPVSVPVNRGTPAQQVSSSLPRPDTGSVEAPPGMAREAQAEAYLAGGDFSGAARQYSALMLAEINGEGPVDQAALDRWKVGLDQAQAGYRWSRRGAWPATTVRVRPGDSLIAIRKRVLAEHGDVLLCTGLIARVNQLRNSTAIRADDELRVPLTRPRVLVDLSARWTFYFLGDEVAAAWRVGVGKQGSETRPGLYTIKDKQENPPWHRPGEPMVAYGDPANPLGTRWMSWDDENGWHSTLGFHGTNDEAGLGGAVSQGCIRMRNSDVEALFKVLPVGSEVRVQP